MDAVLNPPAVGGSANPPPSKPVEVSPLARTWYSPTGLWQRKSAVIAALSLVGTGHLSPVSGAITQEVIDVLAVLNALRAAFPPRVIHDL